MKQWVLLFSDDDQPGIISRVAGAIFAEGGNVLQSEQHTSLENRFYLRFRYEGDDVSDFLQREFPSASWSCKPVQKQKATVLVSKETHCLADILWRARSGDLPLEICAVISNHEDAAEEAGDIPFYFIPQGKDRAAGERKILEVLQGDFAILARYMRVLSGDFLEEAGMPLINVHHSFLPAFPGARPYEEAYERGVKIVGATAHYVVEELDAGEIITQRAAAVDHSYSPDDLRRFGRDQEKLVLADAVRAHAEQRVIREGGRTVVFSA